MNLSIYKIGGKFKQFVIYGTGILEALLTLRLLLNLFGASQEAIFYKWVAGITSLVYYPFDGLFATKALRFPRGGFIDYSLLFAIVVYLLAAFFALLLIDILSGAKRSS